uniref:Uncharacterized protein n=1 Tax=Octopus bimaculoides TaxID=37653 RepID=A0A0L8I6W0_OCTBM
MLRVFNFFLKKNEQLSFLTCHFLCWVTEVKLLGSETRLKLVTCKHNNFFFFIVFLR